MLTQVGFDNKIATLMGLVEITEEVEQIIADLRVDFADRIAITDKFGEEYNAEEESYDFVEKVIENADEYKEKYLDLKEKYVEAFMQNGKEEDVKEEENEENKDNVNLSDLFE